MHRLFLLAIVLTSIFPALAQDNTFALGADCGWNTEYEQKGYKLYNWRGEERECTALMKELGMNAIRIRVWVEDEKGLDSHGQPYCCKADVLEKARRAKALGMDIMIDFHYSDWWADPHKQNIPKAWEKLSYKKMLKALSAHTVDVLTMLKQNGITPRWVQVGNETSKGMLWSVVMDPKTGWEVKDADGHTTITKTMGHWEQNPEQYAGFIAAGYDAVKSVCPDTKVIVHLDNGFDSNLYNKNLDIIKAGGGKWDIIGMSLYPYWSIESGMEPTAQKTIVDCMRNIRSLYKKYGTPCMITETGYEVDDKNPWVMEQGREQFAELLRRARTETDGHCLGVFYWEPECRPSQYKLGAFSEDGHPTSILRALLGDGVEVIGDGFMSQQANQSATTQHPSMMRLVASPITQYDRKVVKLTTTEGDIYVELYNETPIHRDNFLRLATSGALDSTLFHRVIENFMIQGGGPDSKYAPPTSLDNPAELTANEDVPTADGQTSIPAEIVYPKFFHKRGALAAAREPDEDNPDLRSSSSQFYIVWGKWPVTVGKKPYVPLLDYYETSAETRQAQSHRKYWDKAASPMPEQQPGTPWLDGGYTVFGEVLYGLNVVDKIQQTKTDKNDRPLTDIRLLKMEVLN